MDGCPGFSQAKNKVCGFLGAVMLAQGMLHSLCLAGERILAEQGMDSAFESGGRYQASVQPQTGSGVYAALGIIGLIRTEGDTQQRNPVGQRRQHGVHSTVRNDQDRAGFRLCLQSRLRNIRLDPHIRRNYREKIGRTTGPGDNHPEDVELTEGANNFSEDAQARIKNRAKANVHKWLIPWYLRQPTRRLPVNRPVPYRRTNIMHLRR